MKDYYKILGVKKDATEEEIRNSWTQLVKKFHPDQSKGEGIGDERLKEINEAYQVLKHSSTRAEYDLKRVYEKEKGRLMGARVSMCLIALMGFILLGASMVKWNQPSLPNNNKILISTQINSSLKSIFDPDPIIPIPVPPSKNNEKTLSPTRSIDKVVSIRSESTDSSSQSNPILIPAIGIQIPEAKDKYASEQKELILLPILEKDNPYPSISTFHPLSISKDPDKPIESRDQFQIAQVTPAPLLTTEEEVKRFFLRYLDQYNQKNLEGFLSLFSPKAIQNQRDGMEKIKELYSSFFNNSKEIRYRIEGMKMEIYQNAVEVRARYEIVQVTKRNLEKLWKGDIRWVLIKEGGDLKILSLDYQHQKSSR